MDALKARGLETDPRFPSGPWTGFFLQRWLPGRHPMTLDLTFQDGRLKATGRDVVGAFTFDGSYDRADGKCRWTKHYLGKHRVSYAGVNEGQGIWGAWEIRLLWGLYRDRGVFHIWPEGVTPSTEADLTERALLENPGLGGLFNGLAGVVGVALLVAAYFLVRYFFPRWLDSIFQ
jgi:hypothetical protein